MHPNFYCSPVNVFVLWLSGYVRYDDRCAFKEISYVGFKARNCQSQVRKMFIKIRRCFAFEGPVMILESPNFCSFYTLLCKGRYTGLLGFVSSAYGFIGHT